MYLYIIDFDDNIHFKIGITTNPQQRIWQHHKNFGLKSEGIRLLKMGHGSAKAIEKLLLSNCTSITEIFGNIDGGTEVRLIKDKCVVDNILNGLVFSIPMEDVSFELTSEPQTINNSIKKTDTNKENIRAINHVYDTIVINLLSDNDATIIPISHTSFKIASKYCFDCTDMWRCIDMPDGSIIGIGVSFMEHISELWYVYTIKIPMDIQELYSEEECMMALLDIPCEI